MGTSVLPYQYRLNGVISTDKTVMQNIETMCSVAGTWFTYDVHSGKWAVIIGDPADTAVTAFDDSNIIGGISLSGTGLKEYYNRVRVEYPREDLNDLRDFVEIAIPEEDRNANEPDNTLTLSYDIINDPVQAEYVGMIELKQNRLDKIIKFTTDWSQLGLSAGDLITVTNSIYGFTDKLFRIINITESDTDDGSIVLSITALEYDANIYSTDDLYRYERSLENGITSLSVIETPTTPTLTAYNTGTNPYVEIVATVPTGVVNTLDLFVSSDSVNFRLVASEYGDNGNVLQTGDTVTFQYTGISQGDVYAKIRASNSIATSEFSPVGSTTAGFSPSPGAGQLKYVDGYGYPSSISFRLLGNPADYYTVSATSYPAISFTDDTIFQIGPENILSIDRRIPPCGVQLGISMSGIISNIKKTAFGIQSGMTIWINWAEYNASTVATGGYSALSWHDWVLYTRWGDDNSLFGTTPLMASTPGQWGYNFTDYYDGATTYIIAVGISSTIVPPQSSLYTVNDAFFGDIELSYEVPYSTNTVYFDGSSNYYPGVGGSPTPGVNLASVSLAGLWQF